jgi:hypothetical protein
VNAGSMASLMRPYVLLAIGGAWLLTAIYVHRVGFSIFWKGHHDPAHAMRVFRVVIYVVFRGWIAPVLLGAWLLWKK